MRIPGRCMHVLLILALAPPASARSQVEQEPLTLARVLEWAQAGSPRLKASTAASHAAAHRAPAAGALPDPSVQVGFTNLALPDLSSTMSMSMAPSIQVTQGIPFPGKRALREEMAELEAATAIAMESETWWRVRAGAAELFYDLWLTDRSLDVQHATLGLLSEVESVAKSLYASGAGRQSDVLSSSVEVARMEVEIRRLESHRTVAAARLNALLGRDPRSGLAAPVLPPLTLRMPSGDTLRAWAEATRPLMEQARARLSHAEAAVRLARRDAWPDLMVGLQYGQRDRGTGVERMGGAVVGFSLPVFPGRRQRPMENAAEAMSLMADAQLAEARADVGASIARGKAELERARDLIALYLGEILPQARAAVVSAFSSYRVGEVDFPTLLDAELNVNRFQLELHTLVHDYGTALADLEAQIGRELSPSDPSDVLEVS